MLVEFLKACDAVRVLGVRANADNPHDAAIARKFGAEGIGLLRTEHMFYGEGADVPLFKLRKMILSKTVEERRAACDELYPHVKDDIKGTLAAMDGLPVTIRLLDPPLHEFVPQGEDKQKELADSLGITLEDVRKPRRGPPRVQPDDGPPRRPPGHHVPRGQRDADPGDPRGRRRTAGRKARRPSPRS